MTPGQAQQKNGEEFHFFPLKALLMGFLAAFSTTESVKSGEASGKKLPLRLLIVTWN